MVNFVGKTLGPYKLEAPLGKGGMALVYRAYQTSVKRLVAIKVMAPEIANEPGFIERFSREAEVIAQLEHPHILPVIDFGEAEGLHYIVMRYMEGGSLDEIVRQRTLSFEEISHYLIQIASALDYAHKRGVVHRDLKPNNVLLDMDNNTYLTDFGIARLLTSERKLTSTGSVMGTPAYMSPEQAMGRPVDARSDIYALGVMLYEMVLNKLPFSADTPAALIFQHVYEQPRPPKEIRPDLPDAVVKVLDKAMAKSPDMRFQSAMDMASDFAEAVGAAGPSTRRRITAAPSAAPASERTTPPSPAFEPPRTVVDGGSYNVDVTAPHLASNPAASVAPAARNNTPIIIGVVAGLAILAGVGGFVVVNNNNTANATATALAAQLAAQTAAVVAQNSTATQVAILSATPTPTATATATITPTPSPTATHTATATATDTATATPTVDLAGTAQALNVTKTAIVIISQQQATAAAQTQTAQAEALKATGAVRTAAAIQSATARFAKATANAATRNANNTAIALAFATSTPTEQVPPTRVPTRDATKALDTRTHGDLVTAAETGDVDKMVAVLSRIGAVPAGTTAKEVRLPSSLRAEQFTGNSDEENVFIPLVLGTAKYNNFAIATTMTLRSSDAAQGKTRCGFLYHGRFDGDNQAQDMVAVSIDRGGGYEVYARQNGTWQDRAIETGIFADPVAENEVSYSLVMSYVDGQLSLYVDGELKISTQETTFTTGNLGYFYIKGAKGTDEGCDFANTITAQLN